MSTTQKQFSHVAFLAEYSFGKRITSLHAKHGMGTENTRGLCNTKLSITEPGRGLKKVRWHVVVCCYAFLLFDIKKILLWFISI